MDDLLVSLNHNKYNRVMQDLEDRVTALFESRHMYPIWPVHDGVMDNYEVSFHRPQRRIYYQSTKILIGALRSMRNLHNY